MLIVCSGIIFINAISFSVQKIIMQLIDMQSKYMLVERQLGFQISHYNKLAEKREFLSEAIHDFKNHLYCMQYLNSCNREKDLNSYIEDLLDLSSINKIINTGNPVIDALLSEKINFAQKVGIDVKWDLNLPSSINIEYIDLCAVLGNSLDNAIEACIRMTDTTKKKSVLISMNYINCYIVIVISNTYDKELAKNDQRFISTKPNSHLHGFGQKSIARAVKKYNGNIVIKQDENLYKLEIIMSIA